MTREEAVEVSRFIKALIGISEVSIILDTFITTIKEKSFEHDGQFYLCGNLILGGTQGGRLSSRDPNLQNMPSSSTYGKLIKSCIIAPEGWLFCGADFNALEDRVGAILSNDKNKIKEFAQGFDGHSLRAYAFFRKNIHPELQQFDPDDPDSINRIKAEYPVFRGEAKAPSFALQYGGTAYTLNKNIGIPKDQAEEIEREYKALYAGIELFAKQNIEFAAANGYVECAFGLRLRTPVLKATADRGGHRAYDAKSEGRSANNAVTQSWGMLINRAIIATEKQIRQSDFVYDILLSNTIHDAAYFLVRKTPEAVKFLNDVLIKEMEWNDDPKIKSKDVKIGAELDIGLSWDKQHTIPNGATLKQIEEAIEKL